MVLLNHLRERFYPALPWDARTKAAYSLFLIVAGLGSTNLFLASRAFVYHEAILWAAALALASYLFLLSYIYTDRTGPLLGAILFCYLSFFTRPSTGSGPATALAITLVSQAVSRIRANSDHSPPRYPARNLPILAGFLVFLSLSYAAVNYVKFRTVWNAVPLQLHVQYGPERLRRIGGTLFHPSIAPFILKQYFLLPNVRLRRAFPWEYLQLPVRVDASGVNLDLLEPFSSLPACMPALFALAGIGVWRIWRGQDMRPMRVVVIGSFQAGAILLLTVAISQRYLHDFYPFLVLASAVGVQEALSWPATRRRQVLRAALIAAAAASLLANAAFTYTYQSDIIWGVPAERRRALRALRRRVDALSAPLLTKTGTAGNYKLQFRLPPKPSHGREPLLVAGQAGECDYVYLEHYHDGRAIFGFEHFGQGGSHSAPIALDRDRDHTLEVSLDRLHRYVGLRLDGHEMLQVHSDLYPWTEQEVVIGDDQIACDSGKKFSGSIQRLEVIRIGPENH